MRQGDRFVSRDVKRMSEGVERGGRGRGLEAGHKAPHTCTPWYAYVAISGSPSCLITVSTCRSFHLALAYFIRHCIVQYGPQRGGGGGGGGGRLLLSSTCGLHGMGTQARLWMQRGPFDSGGCADQITGGMDCGSSDGWEGSAGQPNK